MGLHAKFHWDIYLGVFSGNWNESFIWKVSVVKKKKKEASRDGSASIFQSQNRVDLLSNLHADAVGGLEVDLLQ